MFLVLFWENKYDDGKYEAKICYPLSQLQIAYIEFPQSVQAVYDIYGKQSTPFLIIFTTMQSISRPNSTKVTYTSELIQVPTIIKQFSTVSYSSSLEVEPVWLLKRKKQKNKTASLTAQ